MKKGILYIVSILLLTFVSDVAAQNVVMNAYIDTTEIRIGEQTKIKLELSADSGYKIVMPQFTENIVEGIEILETTFDTTVLNDGKRNLYTQEYLVTSFDSTMYLLPPFKAIVDSSEYLSNTLALAVYSVPIDTANLQNIAGPKGVRPEELTWEEYRDAVHLSFLLIFFLALLTWIVVRLVNNKPIIRIVTSYLVSDSSEAYPKSPATFLILSNHACLSSVGLYLYVFNIFSMSSFSFIAWYGYSVISVLYI